MQDVLPYAYLLVCASAFLWRAMRGNRELDALPAGVSRAQVERQLNRCF